MTENEMVGWHHCLNGHELEQALGDGEGQGSLVCCSPWGHRGRHDLVTEQQERRFCSGKAEHVYSVDSLTFLDIHCLGHETEHVSFWTL